MRIHVVPTVLLLGSAALLLLLALALLLKGIAVRRAAETFRGRAVETSATVVAIDAKDVSLRAEPETQYFARVRFLPDGAADAVETVTLTAVPAPLPRVGEQLAVAYDPERPERVDVLATEADARGAGRTWRLMGSLVLLAAVGVAAAWLVLVFVVWTS